MRTTEAAHGRWREILTVLGVPASVLNGKHQPCPFCKGKDRFRFDDRTGNGDYYCNQCDAGLGIKFVQLLKGWDYKQAAQEIDKIIGNLPKKNPPNRKPSPTASDVELNQIWNASKPIYPDSPVWKYFMMRGLQVTDLYKIVLRHAPRMRHPNGQAYNVLLAKFSDAKGRPQQIMRAYLEPDGTKASAIPHRLWMKRPLAKGGAIRLGEPDVTMGVAEGIESALSAAKIFKMPVWAVTSEQMLQNWEPPQIARRIYVFGDNDANYVGQTAAYVLAKRLNKENKDRAVEVKIPEVEGFDWNDVLMKNPEMIAGWSGAQQA
jgi:putative DNA primase/helicase